MKKLIIIAVLIFVNSAHAIQGGDVEGNGGDACARDFTRLGRIVYDAIANTEYRHSINMPRLNEAINKASVSIIKGELRDPQGGTVPAANDGISKIYLSKNDWCDKNRFTQEAAIVLHEYLGIAMPGQDQQYQLSGSLYSRVGLSNLNFHTFLETGSDFETELLRFKIKTPVSPTSMVVETESIKRFFYVISIDDSARYQKRAKIFCDQGKERLELSSLYAAVDSKRTPNWFYQESPLQTYKFTSSQQCYRLLRKASLTENDLQITLGLDTLTVVSFL